MPSRVIKKLQLIRWYVNCECVTVHGLALLAPVWLELYQYFVFSEFDIFQACFWRRRRSSYESLCNIDSIDGIDCIQLEFHEMVRCTSKWQHEFYLLYSKSTFHLIPPSSPRNNIFSSMRKKLYFAILLCQVRKKMAASKSMVQCESNMKVMDLPTCTSASTMFEIVHSVFASHASKSILDWMATTTTRIAYK